MSVLTLALSARIKWRLRGLFEEYQDPPTHPCRNRVRGGTTHAFVRLLYDYPPGGRVDVALCGTVFTDLSSNGEGPAGARCSSCVSLEPRWSEFITHVVAQEEDAVSRSMAL